MADTPQSITAIYLDLFEPTYERVAEVGGAKHVRCFPCCHEGGHRPGATCGEPARVLATLAPGVDLSKIAAYAEFSPYAEGGAGGRYALGQVVSRQYVKMRVVPPFLSIGIAASHHIPR